MSELPVLPPDTMDAALHGSFCPKMCTFACPVEAATGRDDAVPWSFHRAVTDLAEGRREAAEVAGDLVACTGCLACREPCTYDQDVPHQVRDARAVARPRTEAADAAVAAIAAGRRPDGRGGADPVDRVAPGRVVLHAGCEDPQEVVDAAHRLLCAAGHDVSVVADGCCGQLARDLGAPDVADVRTDHRTAQLDDAQMVVALDPHCAPALTTTGARVVDLWTVLADAEVAWRPDAPARVTYHDPCLLARGAGVVTPPRRLLERAGVHVVEPEFHGTATACSGAGMGLPLLDPAAADATARRRAGHLAATGAPRTATACSRAADRLRASGHPTEDLAVLLAARLTETP